MALVRLTGLLVALALAVRAAAPADGPTLQRGAVDLPAPLLVAPPWNESTTGLATYAPPSAAIVPMDDTMAGSTIDNPSSADHVQRAPNDAETDVNATDSAGDVNINGLRDFMTRAMESIRPLFIEPIYVRDMHGMGYDYRPSGPAWYVWDTPTVNRVPEEHTFRSLVIRDWRRMCDNTQYDLFRELHKEAVEAEAVLRRRVLFDRCSLVNWDDAADVSQFRACYATCAPSRSAACARYGGRGFFEVA